MFENAMKLVESGVGTAFPCAAVAVGRGYEVYLREYVGNRQSEPFPLSITAHTLFDIASLSKLVSTTMIALRMIEDGVLSLENTLSTYFPFAGAYGDCTIAHLMTHTSGLVPHLPLFRMCKKEDVMETILSSKPISALGEEVHYSCMGYILLGAILEKIGGKTLDILAKELVFEPLGMEGACYCPDRGRPFATTEYRKDLGVWVSGFVHDENAYHMNGIAGNAGVFATLDDMIAFAAMCSEKGRFRNGEAYLSEKLFLDAIRNRTPEKAESRGYGFQLKGKQPSPMGEAMSYGSYGHTGFTGTSLYVDAKSGLWGILLTNSVHYGRENRAAYYPLRRNFYNMIKTEFEMLKEDIKS